MKDNFKHHLDRWIEKFRSVKTVSPDQKAIIPGKLELDSKVNGIPLVDAVAHDLNELAKKLGVEGLSEI